MTVVIRARRRGPLVVEGTIVVIGFDGEPLDLGGRSVTRLCRCGASASAPLCDGTHNRNGFEAPAQDVEVVTDSDSDVPI